MSIFADRVIKLAMELGGAKFGEDSSKVRDEICEGRLSMGSPGHYSWCGDFVHYVYWMVGGCADWINRWSCGRGRPPADTGIGKNISMLVARGQATGNFYAGKAALERTVDPSSWGGTVILDRPGGGHVGILLPTASVGSVHTADGNSINRATALNTRKVAMNELCLVLPAAYDTGALNEATGVVMNDQPSPLPAIAFPTQTELNQAGLGAMVADVLGASLSENPFSSGDDPAALGRQLIALLTVDDAYYKN